MYCPNPDCHDVQETGRPGEYQQGIVTCPLCGTMLQDSQETSDPVFEDDDDQGAVLQPVFETLDPTEVVVVQSALDAEGIPWRVSSSGLQRHLGGQLSPFPVHPAASGAVVISVPQELAEAALEILRDFEDPE